MNLLYLHTHDSGRVLSPFGAKVPTPNLEQFSRSALTFQNCYCVGPTCSPSRAALLTGRYPHQNGMLGLAQRGFSMDYTQHLAQFLGRSGYHTALCGIQHERGWYLDTQKSHGKAIGYDEELTLPTEGYPKEELHHWDMENAKTAAKWLKERKGEKTPFFLSYGMHCTHRPFPVEVDPSVNEHAAVPPPHIPNSPETRHDFAQYLTSAKWADDCMGVVLTALKEAGLEEDTVVFYTTDHGLANPYTKCTLFDSGIGVALILRVPGARGNGRVCDSLVSHLDVFPTLCDVLRLPKPGYLEGVSLLPCLEDPTAEVRNAVFAQVNFHTSYEPIRCIRTQRYKYIRWFDDSHLLTNPSNTDESPTKAYFSQYGFETRAKPREALYDLVYDTGERNNLIDAPAYAAVAEDLRRRLREEMERTDDPLLRGPIPIQPGWKVNKPDCQKASSKDPNDYVSLGE